MWESFRYLADAFASAAFRFPHSLNFLNYYVMTENRLCFTYIGYGSNLLVHKLDVVFSVVEFHQGGSDTSGATPSSFKKDYKWINHLVLTLFVGQSLLHHVG